MRTTKVKREQQQRDRLRQRLMDIATGAVGGCSLEGPEGKDGEFFYSMGAENFFDFIRAVKATFPKDESDVTYEIWNMHHFAEIDSAVEWMWKRGVRG